MLMWQLEATDAEIVAMVPPMVDLQALHCARNKTFGCACWAHIARKYSLQLMASLISGG